MEGQVQHEDKSLLDSMVAVAMDQDVAELTDSQLLEDDGKQFRL